MRYLIAVVSVVVLSGCAHRTPPAAPVVRSGTTVDASYGKAWDAVIDVFAERGLRIETLDRTSGLVVPSQRIYTPATINEALAYADCGTLNAEPLVASTARFNVLVRGDSTRSSVQVRGFFVRTDPVTGVDVMECSSRGLFEELVESGIKARAEGRYTPPRAQLVANCEQMDRAMVDGTDMVAYAHQPDPTGTTCVPKRCQYRGGAMRMKPAAAVDRCRTELAEATAAAGARR